MSGLVKEGFLLMRILANAKSHLTPHVDWNRRWFELYSNGTLKCYDSCYAEQLLFSLHVAADDLVYPDGVSGKPWIISVGMKERGEKLLLEADCEECMERWAVLMTRPIEERSAKSPVKIKPILSPKPKLQLFPFDSHLFNTTPQQRRPAEIHQPGVDIAPKHPLSSQLSSNQEDSVIAQISTQTYDDIVCRKNRPELTYSDYISLSELKDVLKSTFSKNHPSPIMKTKDRNFKSVSSTELPVKDDTRNRPSHPKKEYFVFATTPVQDQDSAVLNSTNQAFGYSHSAEPSKLKFQNSLPKYQRLLKNFWLMFILLPNSKVYKQLIDLTLLIETSLQPLLNCFDHSYTSPNAFLSIQVVGDLYQTYNIQKSSRTDKKRTQSLGWKMSFSSQGVVTSKIIRIKLRVDVTAKVNYNKLEEFLYGMNHLSESEFFCMSWVSFVKGNFPVLNAPMSAHHSACIFLIYKKMHGNMEDIELNQFVPSHLQKVVSHTNTIKEEIKTLKYSDTLSICRLFMDNLNVSETGNAISLPIVKVKKVAIRLKYIDCVFVIGKYHIGITRIENESVYTKADTLSEFWHFSEILGWLIQPEDDIVFIQLKSDMESSDNLVFFSQSVNIFDFIFCQYLGEKKI